ncbi:glycoside hydrolase family 78 protein [Xylariaceae sp. FL0594]|nr:glycoside hydrolase family 78 protein [Xylariaceae sp. FL0594]
MGTLPPGNRRISCCGVFKMKAKEEEEEEGSVKVSVSHVSFEHHGIALGIGEAEPRISWQFEGDAGNWSQSRYSIEVSRAGKSEVFDVTSSESVLVDWPTVALSSAESAHVRVKAYGGDSGIDTDWSDTFSVETGLLKDEDWSGAQVIAANRDTEKDAAHQPVLFRKAFSAGGDIESARLYITAYGIYEAFINGARVGDAVLAPGWQSYNHRLVYDTYDVTHLVHRGCNVIGIHVGEGWYAGRIGFDTTRNIFGDTLGAFALLVMTKADGSKQTIPTDLTWSSSAGAIITSEIYDGELYNSTLEQTGWSTPGFTPPEQAKEWIGVRTLDPPYGRLAAPDGPPIRRVEEVQLKQIITTPSGATVLDFGQNLVGWLRLNVSGPAGTEIRLVHVEVLEHGEIATAPLRTAKQTDRIILSGNGTQIWEPTFTYHGFRYVKVDNWPLEQTPLDGNSVKAIVVHTDMQRTGELESSNPLLNKLLENILWSLKGNFMSIPTDCPQRDERLGWTGDAHAFSPTANFLYDTAGFWRSWLKDVISEQLANKNVVPVVVPWVPAVGAVRPTAVWGDVVVASPWNTYQSSGDLGSLRDQYIGAKAWVDSGIPRGPDGLWDHSYAQYGDWLDPKAPNDNPGGATTSSSLVADAYLVYVTSLVAKMAEELGLEEDAALYRNHTATLTKAYQKAWIREDGTVANETQTGLALSLYFNLFPEGQETAAARRLQKIIADNDYLVGTGFAGTHILGLALSQYGLTDEFYKMLLQKTTVPSWLYQVLMNGTTTWERWDSLLPDGTVNPNQMTSFNHYAFGSVANWVFRTAGGLGPAEPGWRTVRVAPFPGGGLTAAKATYRSPYGQVATEWSITVNGTFELVVVVPPNARAEVVLPGTKGGDGDEGVIMVGSGMHTFTVSGFER